MTGAGPANRALSLGGQLAAAFGEPFIIDGRLAKQPISIGIAVYPDHAADAEGLMKASAFALNRPSARAAGRASVLASGRTRHAAGGGAPRAE